MRADFTPVTEGEMEEVFDLLWPPKQWISQVFYFLKVAPSSRRFVGIMSVGQDDANKASSTAAQSLLRYWCETFFLMGLFLCVAGYLQSKA